MVKKGGESVISKEDEKLFEELNQMPAIDACKIIVEEFWSSKDGERSLQLLRILKKKKETCKTEEEVFDLSFALYELYKKTGNQLAIHLARRLIQQLN